MDGIDSIFFLSYLEDHKLKLLLTPKSCKEIQIYMLWWIMGVWGCLINYLPSQI